MPASELYHVFDDFLTDDQVDQVRKFSENKIKGRANVIFPPKDCFSFDSILNKASIYFDLSSSMYYEIWEQKNTLPNGSDYMGWHRDVDEILHDFGIIKHPLCTTVYYLDIDEDLLDGKLVIRDPETSEDHFVQPKPNRLVIFGPGIYHTVEEYTGYRHSIICNPWDRPLGLIEQV